MSNVFINKDKNVGFSTIILATLLLALSNSLPYSISEPNLTTNYSYAEVLSTEEKASSTTGMFGTKLNMSMSKNTTQIIDQGYNTNATQMKNGTNNTLSFEFQNKNQTALSSNISTANITGIGSTTALGSSSVTGDFNGDGSDDLAIGIPYEDEETGGLCITNLPIASVSASGNDGNLPQNVLDNNYSTRWSSLGIGQFITADLGSTQKICSVAIAWYNGNARQYHFTIATSTDGTVFTNVLTRDSSGTTTSGEIYSIPPTNVRYIKVTVNGNTQNKWASMTELDIFAPTPSQTTFDAGAVNVIYGSSGGLDATALSPTDGRSDQILTQAITSGLEPDDRFGSSLATGDFNKDGFSDLAIGVPGEDVGATNVDAGAVNVIYGSAGGLSTNTGNQIWTQAITDGVEPGDRFGWTLGTGDFNKDGYSDLAIGVPGEDFGTTVGDGGAVNVIYGSSSGLSETSLAPGDGRDDQFWTENSPQLIDQLNHAETGDWFGGGLATGDFNKDGYSDLAVGISDEDLGIVSDAGQVDVIYGSSDGLSGTGVSQGDGQFNQKWTQDGTATGGDIKDTPETGDRFGHALATGDFNKDGFSDLAIGAWEEKIANIRYAGAVNVIYGTSLGLVSSGPISHNPDIGRDNQFWSQNSTEIEGDVEEGDRFGSTLATGDFNKDGISDLAVGVPYEDLGTLDAAGSVNVIYGSSDGLSAIRLSLGDGRADQVFMQNSSEVEGDPDGGDLFGSALVTGDFNKDGISDLAIGVPGETVDIIQSAAGAVNVIYGSKGLPIGSGGLSPTIPLGGTGRADQLWTQNSLNIEGDSEAEDRYGSSLG